MFRLDMPATYKEERLLWAQGHTYVAGVDEAGCGCWAGPVSAAAVILPPNFRGKFVRDSKTLSEPKRDELEQLIKAKAIAWSVGFASAKEVDELNIRRAANLAMRRAIEGLVVKPQALLIDAFRVNGIDLPQKNIIRGDALVKSIVAASILAKTARDRLLYDLDQQYPGYGFAQHKGYGTKQHQEALKLQGVCIEHRMSYAPIKRILEKAPAPSANI